ncbi:MAG TPA: hypothetical protein VFS94_10285 [Gemmatimonadales bacterium]|nr:hypothetical protein [Gemmatimonadales bacterium]
MLHLKMTAALTLAAAALVVVACNESVAPLDDTDGRGPSLVETVTPSALIPEAGAARGTVNPGVKIKTHPNQPTDVVSVVIRLDGDGDGLVNGAPAPTHLRWHTHPGPAIVVVTGGEGAAVTIHHAGSCEQHEYAPGDAFVEGDMIHSAWNESGQDLVLRGTLLLPVGAPPTVFQPAEFTDCGLP